MSPKAPAIVPITSFTSFFQQLDQFCSTDGATLTDQQKVWMRTQGQELNEALLWFAAITNILVEGIMIRDRDGLLRVYNSAAERLLGVPLAGRVGKKGLGRIVLTNRDGSPLPPAHLPALECLRTGEPAAGFVFGVTAKDATRWLETHTLPILDSSGRKTLGVVSSFWDVSEKLRLVEKLNEEASRDRLTGLPNRRALEEKLAQVIASSTRRNRPISFCICDLDHFKLVNDRLGHPAGDEVLRRFAEVLTTSLRPDDFPARLGGDEFAILLDGTDGPRALTILERVREGAVFPQGPDLDPVTATFGSACWSPGMSLEALMKAADEALYVAKGLGRNRVHGIGVTGQTEAPACGLPGREGGPAPGRSVRS